MAFRVKDLMINVLPGEGEGQGGFLSRFPCHCGCTWGYTQGCGPTTGGTPQTFMMMTCPTATLGCTDGVSHPIPTRCAVSHGCPPVTMWCMPGVSPTGHPPTTVFFGLSPFCCMPWSTIAGPVAVQPGGDPAALVEQLAAMKAQLREAIAQIENQEKVVSELAQPQSIAEIEELQSKLKEALDELEHRKSELKKKH